MCHVEIKEIGILQNFDLKIPNFKNADVSQNAITDKKLIITNSEFLNNLTVDDAVKIAIDKIENKKLHSK